MRTRIMVVGGSLGAGVLIVLAMFLTTVVSAQPIKSKIIKTPIFQNLTEIIENNWEPGPILGFIALILLTIYFLSIGAYWGF